MVIRQQTDTGAERVFLRTIALASLAGCVFFAGFELYRGGWSQDLTAALASLFVVLIANCVVFGLFDAGAKG